MSFALNYHNWILSEIRPYIGNDIAEVGAGTGSFTELLLVEKFHKLAAFEPSCNMYPVLKSRFEKVANVDTINGFFGDKRSDYQSGFDSVIYVNVLEHIENDQSELIHVYESLKQGGFIIIFVPALSFLYSDLDKMLGHFRRYHKQGLHTLVAQAGFNNIKIKYFDIAGILPWYLVYVLMKKTMTAANVSLYDNLVVPVMQKFEKIVTPPIGKNLLLVAQKS